VTEEEELLAQQLYRVIQDQQRYSPRSEQARRFELGVSDLGTCAERTRRLLAGIPEEGDQDYLAAFVGTWVGAGFEAAVKAQHPEAILQATVSTEIQGFKYAYRVTGHPDIILPWGVIDGKTTNTPNMTETLGPNQQQLFQRHIYAKAAHEAGYFNLPLGEVKTANVWIDRSAQHKGLIVDMDTYNEQVVSDAALWLDDVYYAWERDEEARKEPPRSWCQVACGHFDDCRGLESDVSGLIDDPWEIAAIEQYKEALAMENKAKKLKEEAKETLIGVTGNTLTDQVRWISVNASTFTVTRQASQRLSITRLKKRS